MLQLEGTSYSIKTMELTAGTNRLAGLTLFNYQAIDQIMHFNLLFQRQNRLPMFLTLLQNQGAILCHKLFHSILVFIFYWHVFGRWDETIEPRGNPHECRANVKIHIFERCVYVYTGSNVFICIETIRHSVDFFKAWLDVYQFRLLKNR